MSKEKFYYVYSTLTAPNTYTGYTEGGADLPISATEVTIAGGANLANKHLDTPRGVATRVTEEELEFLKRHPTFILHEKGGFVTVSEKKVDAEVVAADMEGRDKSAPLVDEDFADKVDEETGETVTTSPKANAPTNRRRA